jgi:hypothetical protein
MSNMEPEALGQDKGATMTPEESIAVVRGYYEAYRSDSVAETTSALEAVLDSLFSLESPIVDAQFGGPVTGATAMAAAVGAAPFLKRARIEALYGTPDGGGVAALIEFPSPVGVIVQSEHFDIDAGTGRITRLRSYYDPRKLLPAV